MADPDNCLVNLYALYSTDWPLELSATLKSEGPARQWLEEMKEMHALFGAIL